MALVDATSVFAQVPPGSPGLRPRPTGVAAEAPEVPTLDGDVLNDPAWKAATPMTSFTQEQPIEGAESTERTEVRVIFTKDTLYIGAVMYDSDPSGIVYADPRRDASVDDVDSFRVLVDTYRDRQNGFVFGTSAAGGEYDGQVTNEGQGAGGMGVGTSASGSGGGFNINWDGAWQVRTKISDIGWTAEFAIPFRTLRFPGGTDQTWGVNFQRNIRRKNERAYWAPIPRQFNLFRVSLTGTVSGIRPPALRNLKVLPYVLGRTITSGVDPAPTDNDAQFGGDLKYSVTPALTLDGTVNTDFAQVEVDDQQVNLDRFNLYFPEKRPFFLENAGFFSVGNQGEVDLFFSRRIGLADNGVAVPIIAGARLSGKAAGKYNVGLLNMQTNDSNDTIASSNFSVMRVSRDLPNRSQVGVLFTQRIGVGDLALDDDYGRTYSVDGRWGIGQNTVVSGFVANTEANCAHRRSACDPAADRGPRPNMAYNLRWRTNLQRIDVDAGYQEVGSDFDPEMGFLTRYGYRKPDVRIMTRFRPKVRFLQEMRPHVSYRGFWGIADGFQETGFAHYDIHWQFKDSSEFHTGFNMTQEGVRVPFQIFPGIFVPSGSYNNSEAQIALNTNQGRRISIANTVFAGGFFTGSRTTLNSTLRIRAGQQLTGEIAYSLNNVNLPQGDFETNLIRTRLSYSFTPRLFLQSLVQYNDRADVWSMNLRFGWLQAANTGLFVVYNDTRGLYDLNPTPRREDRSLVIKFSRMFDLLQ